MITIAEAPNAGHAQNARSRCARRDLVRLAIMGVALLPLPGCQSIAGSPSLSQVRVVDASYDAGGVGGGIDAYQGGTVLAYNLGFNYDTTYVPIAPGNSAVVITPANGKQTIVSASATFLANAQYTAVVAGPAVDLQEIILKDQSSPAPAGEISVRILDESTRQAGLDIYLIPSGSTIVQVRPALTNLSFGMNSGYLNIPATGYTLAVLPTGTIPTVSGGTLYTSASTTLPGGEAVTYVITDPTLITVPGLSALQLVDYDPVG